MIWRRYIDRQRFLKECIAHVIRIDIIIHFSFSLRGNNSSKRKGTKKPAYIPHLIFHLFIVEPYSKYLDMYILSRSFLLTRGDIKNIINVSTLILWNPPLPFRANALLNLASGSDAQNKDTNLIDNNVVLHLNSVHVSLIHLINNSSYWLY